MRIGIIGAGNLGRALGMRLGDAGHEVMFAGGVSAADAASELGTRSGSNRDAATFGGVVVLAVPFALVAAALTEAGPLNGKVLWSCVNALKPDLSGLAVGFDTSAAEQVASLATRSRVVGAIPPFAERSPPVTFATTESCHPACSSAATTTTRKSRWRSSSPTWARMPSTPDHSPQRG
jgi:predicted dinucleotide-binding enzyme